MKTLLSMPVASVKSNRMEGNENDHKSPADTIPAATVAKMNDCVVVFIKMLLKISFDELFYKFFLDSPYFLHEVVGRN